MMKTLAVLTLTTLACFSGAITPANAQRDEKDEKNSNQER